MEQPVEKFLALYLEALENDIDVSKIEQKDTLLEEVEEKETKVLMKTKNVFQSIEKVKKKKILKMK